MFSFNIDALRCMHSGGSGSGGGSIHSFNFVDKLMLQTLFPIGCALSLLLGWAIHKATLANNTATSVGMGRGDDESDESGGRDASASTEMKKEETYFRFTLENIDEQYLTMFLYLTYLILPSVSTTIFQAYSCIDVNPDNIEGLSEGNSYLVADYSIACPSERYSFGVIWASVMVVVYPVGISVSLYAAVISHWYVTSWGRSSTFVCCTDTATIYCGRAYLQMVHGIVVVILTSDLSASRGR